MSSTQSKVEAWNKAARALNRFAMSAHPIVCRLCKGGLSSECPDRRHLRAEGQRLRAALAADPADTTR